MRCISPRLAAKTLPPCNTQAANESYYTKFVKIYYGFAFNQAGYVELSVNNKLSFL